MKYNFSVILVAIICVMGLVLGLFGYAVGAPEGPSSTAVSKTKGSSEKAEAKVAAKQPLGFFHSIVLYAPGDLYITQSDEPDFTIEATPKIQALINAYVKNQVLYVEIKDIAADTQSKITYYLKLKNLQSITSHTSSAIYIKDGFETKVLSIALLSGFSEANLNVDVTKLTTKIVGASKINLQGVADEHELSINGIGEFQGSKLKSKLVTVKIFGSGIAKLNVTEDLIVTLKGDGIVNYCGKPNIVKEIEGKGQVTPLASNECN